MELQELIRLSFQSLFANKLRSILTTLGIIIGVFAIILLVSLGTGLQGYITSQISGLGSNLIFVIPGRQGGARTAGGIVANKLLLSDASLLSQKLKNEAEVAPVVQQITTLRFENATDKAVSVLGTASQYSKIVDVKLEKGSFFTPVQERSGSKVVLIGQTVITTLFNNENPVGKKVLIGTNKFTVIGTLGKRGSLFGVDQDNAVIIPVTVAQHQFGLTHVNGIYISANRSDLVALVKEQARNILLRRLTEDDFTVQTQESALSTITNVTNVLTIALGGIAAISLLVGGIGVANIMLVSVTERTKEIGLRKALGAKRSDILNQFLFEAVILSLTGGIIGIILGIGASLLVAKFFYSIVTPWSIVLAFFFSIGVGVLFGTAPAIKASKLSPIEAIRYE